MRCWLTALTSAALLACSHAPSSGSKSGSKATNGKGCVADVGCPKTVALPTCSAEALTAAVAAPDAVRALVQKSGPAEVSVYGQLVEARSACTMLHCGGARCCNSCGGFLALELGSSTGYADNANRLLLIAAESDKADKGARRLGCGGDDSGMCCSHDLALVVAKVELHVHGSYSTALYGPSYQGKNAEITCAVAKDAAVPVAAPLRVAVPELACADDAPVNDPIARLEAGDPVEIGDFANNQIGCVSKAIIAAGAAMRPKLEALLVSPKPIAFPEGKRQRTVGDAAAFLLSQVCQVPRYMAGGVSSKADRERFVESIAKNCGS